MSAWQPIETAPKDGDTEVLIYGALGTIKVAWYSGGEWKWEYDNDMTYGSTVYRPTHWMPLPEPPDGEQAG